MRLDFSRPGKPMDNPFIESFNGRLRDEHLNTELFFSVADAQAKLLEWQRDYNEVRPHSSLGDIPPREFVAAWQYTRTARGEIDNLETVQFLGAGPEMDPYWKITTKLRGAIRFDYKLRSEITVSRKKGKWEYKSGTITIADVGLSNLYEPLEAWAVKPLKCQKCDKVTRLKGASQSGIVDGSVVRLYWGNAKPAVLAEAQIKIPCKPMPDCAQWKSRLFVSSEFLDRVNNVPLLLKHEGVVEPPKPIKDPQGLRWINYRHTLRRIE